MLLQLVGHHVLVELLVDRLAVLLVGLHHPVDGAVQLFLEEVLDTHVRSIP